MLKENKNVYRQTKEKQNKNKYKICKITTSFNISCRRYNVIEIKENYKQITKRQERRNTEII